MASNLEVMSVIADIGQLQWLFMFFRVSYRTPVSRVRDCCDLTEISGISGRCLIFGWHVDFDHFWAWRACTSSRYSTGESPPIKAGHWGTIPHLETTCSRFNTSMRRRTCSLAGPGRSQQLEILPSLNSKEFFSGPPTFLLRQHFHGHWYFTRRKDFPSAWFSPGARILPSA